MVRNPYALIQKIYNLTLRPFLPDKIGMYHTVPVKDQKLLDFNDYKPYKKFELLEMIQKNTFSGSRVLIIGGGQGLAAVVAARRVLPNGEVIVYEAAKEQCRRTRQTLSFNQMEEYVSIRNVIIGSEVDIWGETDQVQNMDPADLPKADLWAIDIEGGEVGLLKNAAKQNVSFPNKMVIESHPNKGADAEKICEIIDGVHESKKVDIIEVSDKTSAVGGDLVLAEF